MSHGPQKKGKNRQAKGFTPKNGRQAGEQLQNTGPKKGPKKASPKKAAVPKQGQPPKVTQQRSSKRQWGPK